MTDERWARLDALAAAATPGPWVAQCRDDGESGREPWYVDTHAYEDGPEPVVAPTYPLSKEDAAFIAACDPQTIGGMAQTLTLYEDVLSFGVRIWSQVDRTGECWEWTGKTEGNGYGVIEVADRLVRVHRAAFELAHGPIPEGLYVLHRCDNRVCCRPGHLFLGTNADNMADMASKGRSRNQSSGKVKTHCPNGHPYAEFGLRPGAAKKLACRLCMNDRARAYQARKRAEARP